MSNTTYLPITNELAMIGRRLQGVFNWNDPQWGRPTNSSDNGKEHKAGADDQSASESSSEGEASPPPEHEPNDRQDKERQKNSDDQRNKDVDGPPDLDEIWKDVSNKLGGLFGGRNKGTRQSKNQGGSVWNGQDDRGRRDYSDRGRGDNTSNDSQGRRGVGGGIPRPRMPQVGGKGAGFGAVVILAVVLIGWMASGFFTVQEGSKAVVMTFGQWSRTVNPGLQWHWPYPIQSQETVAVSELQSINIGSSTINSITGISNASMLTQDKNILDIRFTVQYQIKDIKNYLFNNADPQKAVEQAAESAVREVVGSTPMDIAIVRKSNVIIQGDQVIANPLKAKQAANDHTLLESASATVGVQASSVVELTHAAEEAATAGQTLAEPIMVSIQRQLDKLNSGIEILTVNISDVQPPDKVKPAFDAARSATAERESLINEGRAYADKMKPESQGRAARLEQQALGYKAKIVSEATGDTQRFLQIYEQYKFAPQVTRERMYLEAMQDIFANVTKVMVDSRNNSLLYLPLDKIMQMDNSTKTDSSQVTQTPEMTGNVVESSNGTSVGSTIQNSSVTNNSAGNTSKLLPRRGRL